MQENLFEYLKNAKDIKPDEHDGSYELVQEAVKLFSTVPEDKIDVADLNALWFLCVGTWNDGIQPKKARIEKCHLSDENKEKLKDLLDNIDRQVKTGKYSNSNSNTDIGMFGTGFHTFFSGTPETAKRFIKMCAGIVASDNDEKALEIAENTLENKLAGMSTSSISQFLHCLRPSVFPIINKNQGLGVGVVFKNLNVPLVKPDDSKKLYCQHSRD
jgi:hypothetical protein